MRRLGALLVLLLALAACRGEEEAAREPLLDEPPEAEGTPATVLRWAVGAVDAIVPPVEMSDTVGRSSSNSTVERSPSRWSATS